MLKLIVNICENTQEPKFLRKMFFLIAKRYLEEMVTKSMKIPVPQAHYLKTFY